MLVSYNEDNNNQDLDSSPEKLNPSHEVLQDWDQDQKQELSEYRSFSPFTNVN